MRSQSILAAVPSLRAVAENHFPPRANWHRASRTCGTYGGTTSSSTPQVALLLLRAACQGEQPPVVHCFRELSLRNDVVGTIRRKIVTQEMDEHPLGAALWRSARP